MVVKQKEAYVKQAVGAGDIARKQKQFEKKFFCFFCLFLCK
jgi:hypothetical protein